MRARISGAEAVQQAGRARIVSGMLDRITFITLGQTPRSDLVPEIVDALTRPVAVEELGALDEIEPEEIARLAPDANDHALVTRLRDGSEVVIGKQWLVVRLQELLDSAPMGPNEARVLLCTGDFGALKSDGLFLDAQHLVDHGVDALCHSAASVGLVVPLARQVAEHHYETPSGQELHAAVASPYGDDDFEAVGRSLTQCDLIVMHCMGYTATQRDTVAAASERPVLLARRLVSAALSQLL
jgi:protein AroM